MMQFIHVLCCLNVKVVVLSNILLLLNVYVHLHDDDLTTSMKLAFPEYETVAYLMIIFPLFRFVSLHITL